MTSQVIGKVIEVALIDSAKANRGNNLQNQIGFLPFVLRNIEAVSALRA